MRRFLASKILVAAGLAATSAIAQTAPMKPDGAAVSGDAKRVRITYENLTDGQVFSPSVFMSHNASAPPLFKEGERASFGLMRIAEEGNAGPLLSAEVVKKLGGPTGSEAHDRDRSHPRAPDGLGRFHAGDDQRRLRGHQRRQRLRDE